MALSSCNNELCPGSDMDVAIAVPVRFRAYHSRKHKMIYFFSFRELSAVSYWVGMHTRAVRNERPGRGIKCEVSKGGTMSGNSCEAGAAVNWICNRSTNSSRIFGWSEASFLLAHASGVGNDPQKRGQLN